MAGKDYYETLGIKKGAADEEIKKAYRTMAKKYHPDANPGNKQAEERFKEINEAYSILSDPQKRATYDQYGSAAFEQGAGAEYGGFSGMDMGDILNSFFGGGFGDIFGSGASAAQRGPRRGADLQTSMTITLEEAVFGAEKEIQIASNETCDTCKGTGAKPGTYAESCKHCGGSGQERVQRQTLFGTQIVVQPCTVCKGEGKIIKEPCSACRGAGRVKRSKVLKVTIPRGIDNEQSIRLSGKGDVGEKGGPAGDLMIVVYVRNHPRFTREGINILADVPITFVQAALGAEIQIPTLAEPEKFTLKPGTQTGSKQVFRGKGAPNVRNNRVVGDLIATFRVIVPTNLTERQKQLLREFAGENGGDDHRKGLGEKFKDIFN